MHQVFRGERGETDVIQMMNDTSDYSPKKQALRSAAHQELARQTEKMEWNSVIQSPWSSPVMLVKKKDGF